MRRVALVSAILSAYWALIAYLIWIADAFEGGYLNLVVLLYLQHTLFSYVLSGPMYVGPGSMRLDENTTFVKGVRLFIFCAVLAFSLWFIFAEFKWNVIIP